MRYLIMVLPVLLFLASCEQKPDDVALNQEPEAVEEVIHVTYKCEESFLLQVSFLHDSAEITLPDGQIVHLPIAVSGSGFRYATPQNELRGKGRDATWTAGRRVPMNCQAQPSTQPSN